MVCEVVPLKVSKAFNYKKNLLKAKEFRKPKYDEPPGKFTL